MRVERKHKLLLSLGIAGMVLLPLLLLFCLQTTQYLLKVSAVPRLEGHQQHTLLLHKDSVQWEKQGRELKINGHFFDVSSIKQMGSMVAITGHYDHLETAVFQLLGKALKHQQQHGVFNRILLLLQCVVVLPLFSIFLHRFTTFIRHTLRPPARYKDPYLARMPLPPRFCLSFHI